MLYIHILEFVIITVLIIFIHGFHVATAIFIVTFQCFLETYIEEISNF